MDVFFFQDDRQSLERLHEIMHSDAVNEQPVPLQTFAHQDEAQNSAPPRIGRRQSLPSNPSLASLSSSISILPPEISPFEQRRRRAAKLTNFFGVNHREIMNDIFESIEKGVEEERGNGTLNPDEVNVSRSAPASL
jgi:hypothetical protein